MLSFTLLWPLGGVVATALASLGLRLFAARSALRLTRGALARLQLENHYNDLVVAAASDGLVVQDMCGIILWVNPGYCRLQGLPANEMIGRNPLTFCMPHDSAPSPEEIAAFRYDPDDAEHTTLHLHRNRRGDGTLFWNQISVSFRTAPDGSMNAILVCRDVTGQVESEAQLRETTAKLAYNAAHDGLTAIANRATMLKHCGAKLGTAADIGTRVGLLHLDIDDFKAINDSHGHNAGDAVLIHVANALSRSSGPRDLVARVGGDEFVVICPDVQGLPDLCERGAALAQAAAEPLRWKHNRITARVSIGAALSRPGARDPSELIQQADFALVEVRRSGRGGVAAYDEALHQRHTRRNHRSHQLSHTIASDGLEFHFQPVVVWPSGKLLGFETLARWRHPSEGMIAPGDFLDMAREMGLMGDIDLAAMRAGVAMKLALRDAGLPNKVISFNASGEGLVHPAYLDQLQRLTAEHGIDPAHLTVEVLETILFDDQMSASPHAERVSQISALGYKTVLDDFGIGHAGLAHLAKLRLTGVKIDRSLISGITCQRASGRIVTTVLELCTDLGLDVIGEGVEDLATATALGNMGCHLLQGYHIARPMAPEAALSWAKDYRQPLPANQQRRA